MATRSKSAGQSAATAVLDAPNGERERVFEPFRHYGYLEADLDPLGFLPPVSHPSLRIEGELADEARRIYCGTVGAEFMQGSRFRHTAQFRRWRSDKKPADCTYAQLEVVPPQELEEIFPHGR